MNEPLSLSRAALAMRKLRAKNPEYDKNYRQQLKERIQTGLVTPAKRRRSQKRRQPIERGATVDPPPLYQQHVYPESILSIAEATQMQIDFSGVNPVPVHRQNEIEGELTEQLDDYHVLEKVCCICDQLFSHSRIITLPEETAPLEQMARILKAPPDLPSQLIAHYDGSLVSGQLQDVLLSKKGIIAANTLTCFRFCQPCLNDVRENRMPKFAIANGLWIGELPDTLYNSTTRTEFCMTALAQSSVHISTVYSSGHRVLKSHAYMFRAKPEPPAAMLPRNIYESPSYRVAIVGALTHPSRVAVAKRFAVNSERVRNLLDFYRNYNHYYTNVGLQHENIRDTDGTEFLHDVASNHVPELEQRLVNIESRHNSPNQNDGENDDIAVYIEESSNLLRTDDCDQNEPATVTLHRSSTIVGDRDPRYWTICFPELFPFGRGGLQEMRTKAISLKLFINYLFRLSHRRFQQHPTFLLVAFDVLSKNEGSLAMFRYTKVNATVAQQVYSVTRNQLADYVRYQDQRVISIRKNAPLPPRPENNANVRALEHSIETAMKSVWASAGERKLARREVFNMASVLSHASAFWTLSPDTTGTYRIAQMCGDMTDREVALNELLDEAQTKLLTRQQRAAIAGKNPYLCAQYYHRIVTLMIDVVLNFDIKEGRSRKQGGLFGHTEAFYGATEETNAKNLHLHMLVWFHGVPKTDAEFRQLCNDNKHNFKQRVLDFHDSILTAQYPINIGPKCPLCADGTLKEVQWTKSAYKRKRSSDTPPITSECDTCHHQYSSGELLDTVIGLHQRKLPIDQRNYLSANIIEFMNASWKPLPHAQFTNDLQSLQQTLSLMLYQEHKWNHVASCFKKSIHVPCNICRFLKPELRAQVTHLKPDFEVKLARWIGHEYLNAYIPLLMRTMKFNHDFKLLIMGCGPDKTFYMMKYATKQQSTLNNLAIIQAMEKSDTRQTERDQWRLANEPGHVLDDAHKKGQRRLLSMLNTLSAPTEVGAPMAALYFHNAYGPFYKSHDFVPVYLRNAINELIGTGTLNVLFPTAIDDQSSSATETRNTDNEPAASNPYQDYKYRPDCLSDLSYCQFILQYHTKKQIQIHPDMRFQPEHSRATTHSPVRRTGPPPLPFVHCTRLPDIHRDDLPHDERTLYYQMVLILHKPHRTLSDFLINDDDSWQSVFNQWPQTNAAKDYIRFNNEYYVGKRKAQTASLDQTIATILNADNQEDDYNQPTGDANESHDDSDDENDDHDLDIEALLDGLNLIAPSTANIDNLVNTNLVANHGVHCLPTTNHAHIDPIVNMDEYIDALNARTRNLDEQLTNNQPHFGTTQEIATNVRIPFDQLNMDTKIIVLRDALADCENWTPPVPINSPPVALRPTATLQEISAHFHLDKQQHRMFVSAAKAVLKTLAQQNHILSSLTTENSAVDDQQFIGFLSGEAGMGKSEVLLALLALNETWQPGCVRSCALAGVAADRADGMTIHSMFKIAVDGHNSRQSARDVHAQDIEDFASLKLLIVDEASTVGQDIYGRIDRKLRALKQRRSQTLGGVHLLMAGDWLQQGPVASRKVYMDPSSANLKNNETAQLCCEGYAVYSQINFVVFLETNWRHRNNPFWAQLLSRWRRGDFQQNDLDFVNQTCVRTDDTSATTAVNEPSYCPILVTSNLLRHEYNRLCTQLYAERQTANVHYRTTATPVTEQNHNALPSPLIHRFHPVLHESTRGAALTAKDQRSLHNLQSDDNNRMDMQLDLMVGMPVMCTQNFNACHALRLKNGTLGYIHSFQFHPDDHHVDHMDPHTNQLIRIHSKLPSAIYFQKFGQRLRTLPNLPPGIVPLIPLRKQSVQFSLRNRRFTCQADFLPITCAFSLTVDKCQGVTLKHCVISPLLCKFRPAMNKSALYVATSRVTVPEHLLFTQTLTMDPQLKNHPDYLWVPYFTPNDNDLLENNRLLNLAQHLPRQQTPLA